MDLEAREESLECMRALLFSYFCLEERKEIC